MYMNILVSLDYFELQVTIVLQYHVIQNAQELGIKPSANGKSNDNMKKTTYGHHSPVVGNDAGETLDDRLHLLERRLLLLPLEGLALRAVDLDDELVHLLEGRREQLVVRVPGVRVLEQPLDQQLVARYLLHGLDQQLVQAELALVLALHRLRQGDHGRKVTETGAFVSEDAPGICAVFRGFRGMSGGGILEVVGI